MAKKTLDVNRPTYPKDRMDIRLEEEEDVKKWSEVVFRVKTLYNDFKKIDKIEFKISTEALKVYNLITAELEDKTEELKDGLLDSAAGRAQDYILKLAMLIEIGYSEPKYEISKESIELASLLVIKFFLPCFMNIRDLLSEDIKRNLIEKVLKIFRSKNGTCTRSDLINYGHLLQRERDEALSALLECGAVEERKVIETGKKILILKNDNRPKIEIDSLAAKFQNLEFSKLSKLSKLSNSAQEQEYSAESAETIYTGGNNRVSVCLSAESAESAYDGTVQAPKLWY